MMDFMEMSATRNQPVGELEMQSAPHPGCVLCGSGGEFVHKGLRDRLFGASGSWNLKRCTDPRCGILWLDPMPLKEELWKAYRTYYTHSTKVAATSPGPLKRLYLRAKRGYWAARYGYGAASESFLTRAMGVLLYLFPVRRADVDEEVRFLPCVPGGCLLDVGCGSGEWLALMRRFGWQVRGNDFDANAVQVATGMGLDVGCGPLEEQRYPSESFDAVVLHHVLEHVPDPVGTLRECARILKPGGRVLAFTPNSRSFGHWLFGEHWRGLEPPRHLQIMTPETLGDALTNAGFAEVSSRTLNSCYVLGQSYRLWRAKGAGIGQGRTEGNRSLVAIMLAVIELIVLQFNRSAGECLFAVGVKR
jgi:2-polyprenyl-3-methyl-5-hydroxy-6-metoxy-1,4-benzoquinol methylase